MLQWSELDLIECLEAIPEVDEYKTNYRFTVCKDSLRLVLLIKPYGGDIEFSLYCDGIEQHIFHLKLFSCPRVRYLKNPKALDYYKEYLEFDTSPSGRYRFTPAIERGVRLTVNPHISLNLF